MSAIDPAAGSNVYLRLMRIPGVPGVAIPGLIGRFVPAMVGLAVLFLVRSGSGGFGTAGLATGAVALGGAIAAPFVGRIVDAIGVRRSLPWFSFGYALACVGLIALVRGHAPEPAIVAECLFVGLLTPPVSPYLRTLWIRLTDDPQLQHAGSSMEAALVEVAFLLGPVLAAALISSAGPSVALATVAVFGLVGGLGVARSAVVKRLPVQHGTDIDETATTSIPWRSVGILVAVVGLVTIGFGAIDVAVPAAATRDGHGAATGLLLALWALGSMVAAIVTGHRPEADTPLHRRIARSVAILAAFSLLLPFWPNLYVLGIALLVSGLGVAPFFVVSFRLGAELSPPGRMTQVSSTLSSAIYSGSAVGTAVAGQIVTHADVRIAFAFAPVAAILAAGLALALRRG